MGLNQSGVGVGCTWLAAAAQANDRAYKITKKVWSQIERFATFPPTGVSLRQMVMFGRNTNPGTLLLASSFLLGSYSARD